jgi:hypothetical protein
VKRGKRRAIGQPDMNHPLQCRCGTLKGSVRCVERANRAVCYCKDCQAYARHLGVDNIVLDASGGTDVVATVAKHVALTAGIGSLACLSLSEKGLLRWYARCCNTPIANTPRNYKLSYAGLVHTCLKASGPSLDESFGPVRVRVNTGSANGSVEGTPVASAFMLLRLLPSLARARIDGSYERTPFFDANTGDPVARPKVLSRIERARATSQ